MPSWSSACAGTTPTAATSSAARARTRMRERSACAQHRHARRRARSPARVRSASSEQLGERRVEDLAVPVDVGRRGRRAHQRHVVERRHDDAAVERVEVQVVVELGVDHGLRLAAADGRLGVEVVLGARAQLHDAPGRAMAVDRRLHALAVARRELGHADERLVGEHLGERRARRGQRQRVAGERAADAAPVEVVGLVVGLDPLEHRLRDAVGRDRHAGAERLADRDDVGRQAPGRDAAAGPGRDRVRLVVDQQRPGLAAGLLEALEEARLGQHDADVRERGLGQHAGDVAARERAPDALEVVELDDDRRLGGIDLRPDVAGLGHASRRPRR